MDIQDYPWVWPPKGFEPLDLNGTAAVTANSTLVAFTPYTIPLLQEGWITQAGVELSGYAPGTYFTLSLNSQAIRNYERVSVPLGAPNTPATLYIKLRPNQPFALTIVNASGATIAARWRFYGWYYPQS